ncbi:MAG: biopolymer transporter ExbD [Sphingomonadaceae bacterium]|nr:biopolymer transporter ExbD [Sphingomonadaceae bacterium]
MAMAGSRAGGRGKRRRGARAPMAEINVTPFVDVMLVLLIIFMVTAPLLTAGVPIELPESRAKALSEERLQITLSIAPDGTVFVEEQPVALASLPATLALLPRQANGKAPLVTLRADKALDYGRVMAVMGELNRASFTSITLVTNAAANTPGETVAQPEDDSGDEFVSDGSGGEQ